MSCKKTQKDDSMAAGKKKYRNKKRNLRNINHKKEPNQSSGAEEFKDEIMQ